MITENTKRPMIVAEAQGYVLPAQLNPRRSGTAAATRSAVPR
jgi:hypothetical protein